MAEELIPFHFIRLCGCCGVVLHFESVESYRRAMKAIDVGPPSAPVTDDRGVTEYVDYFYGGRIDEDEMRELGMGDLYDRIMEEQRRRDALLKTLYDLCAYSDVAEETRTAFGDVIDRIRRREVPEPDGWGESDGSFELTWERETEGGCKETRLIVGGGGLRVDVCEIDYERDFIRTRKGIGVALNTLDELLEGD